MDTIEAIEDQPAITDNDLLRALRGVIRKQKAEIRQLQAVTESLLEEKLAALEAQKGVG